MRFLGCVFEVLILIGKPDADFIIILRAAFTHIDPKNAKKDDNLTVIFTLLGSLRVKTLCVHVDEIDPRERSVLYK
jgi:hypothetical protein